MIWSLIQGFLEVVFNKYTNRHIKITDILTIIWKPQDQFWFLYALFAIFITSIFVFSIIKRKYIAFIVSILLSTLLFIFNSKFNNNIPAFNFICHYWIYFVIGIGVGFKINRCENILIKPYFFSISCFLFIVAQYLIHRQAGSFIMENDLSLLIAMLGISMCIFLSYRVSGNIGSILTKLGSASLIIYLMHTIIASGMRIILHNGLSIASFPVHLILGSAVGIIIPWFIYESKGRNNIFLFEWARNK